MKKETAKTIMLVLFLLIIASFALGMFTSMSAFAYIGIVLTIVLIIAYSVIWDELTSQNLYFSIFHTSLQGSVVFNGGRVP